MVDLEAHDLRRIPAIMDIMLELQSPVMQHIKDTVIDTITLSWHLDQSSSIHGSVFKDAKSLDSYWLEQSHAAAILREPLDPRLRAAHLVDFDISAERSTAGWVAALDGDATEGVDGPSFNDSIMEELL